MPKTKFSETAMQMQSMQKFDETTIAANIKDFNKEEKQKVENKIKDEPGNSITPEERLANKKKRNRELLKKHMD